MKNVKEVKLLPYPLEDNAVLEFKNIRIVMSYTFMHHMIHIYSCGLKGSDYHKADQEFIKALKEIRNSMHEEHKKRKNKCLITKK